MDNFIHGAEGAALNICGCGKLHFTYGPLTIHFEHKEFTRFAGEVGRLAAHLQHVIAGRELALIPGQSGNVCH